MPNRSLSISNAMMIAVTSVASMTSMATTQSYAAAPNYQTYVIHTYGGEALLPAVRQQLAGTGSTAAIYQDRLILRTTTSGYQAVQQLLAQIDGVPQAITVAVRVGKQGNSAGSNQQNRIIINNNGIQGYGNYGSQTQSSQGSSFYQVQTLSGKPASISTSTLLSLAQPLLIQQRSAYNRPSTLIVIQGQTLVTASQGIAVTPRLLSNGQVQVSLNQVEEQLTNNRHAPIDSQSLNTTITLPKGQWVTIGSIRQNNQGSGSGVGSSWSQNSQYEYPIEIKVQ
ncbi:hypothetical protein PSAR109036_05545 [Psychrobacter arenosus]|uniref:hypothetical protein n=1 Tax=Psychrobacter arenosus TaxID=256326 RepID=UPI00191A4A81|nr:hypothetical protein [Psychrobacter arenosus]